MKTRKISMILLVLAALPVCFEQLARAGPMGTAFTYQGHLYDNNDVADDLYDLAFKLYDANVGGSKAANDVNVADVDVIDGYFTVELDFGPVPPKFLGDRRWLEIGVRPGQLEDPNSYTPLSPRQEVTPTPYAIYAKKAGSAASGIGGSGTANYIPRFTGSTTLGNSVIYELSGNIGIGGTANEKLDVTGHINSSESYKLDGETVLSTVLFANLFVGEDVGQQLSPAVFPDILPFFNTAVGYQALYSDTEGSYNTVMGFYALYSNTTGSYNSAMGSYALEDNTTGEHNTATGVGALGNNTTGTKNTAMGLGALDSISTGSFNTAVGFLAGPGGTGSNNSALGTFALGGDNGYNNVAVGSYAGSSGGSGNGNVFLGYKAGYNESGSDKLYIANSDSNNLIYGEFDTGRVGIMTTSPAGTLDVNGPIYQRGGVVHADYVFEAGYELESIEQHSEFMWQNKHLPAIPKARVDKNGREIVEIGSHRRGIVEELEKAHIYIEQLHKQNKALEERLTKLEAALKPRNNGSLSL